MRARRAAGGGDADHPRRRAPGRRFRIGTASKALNRAMAASTHETREKVLRVARELGYRPNDLAQSLHRVTPQPLASFPMTALGASPSRSSRRWRTCWPTGASPSSCATPPTIRSASASTSISCWVSASTGSSSPPAAPTSGRALHRHLGGLPVIYVFAQADDVDSLRLLPDDEGGAFGWRPSISRAGTASGSPMSPGQRISRPCALRHRGYRGGARRRPGLRRTAELFPHRQVVRSLGPARRLTALFDGTREPPDGSSAAMTRSGAASPMAARPWHQGARSGVDGRLRQLGYDGGWRRGRPLPAST